MVGPADPENEHQAIGWKTFNGLREKLEGEQPGRYVLVHDEEVLGFFDSPVAAMADGLAKFPPSTFLVRGLKTPPVIEPAPRTYHHPRPPRPAPPPTAPVSPEPAPAVPDAPPSE